MLDAETWRAGQVCAFVTHTRTHAHTHTHTHTHTHEPTHTHTQVAAFVPANIPICMGMLMTPPTLGNVLFWQWVNQSYNAGFNYSNRYVQRFRGGLVFKAHRLCVSLNSTLESTKEEEEVRAR